MSFEQTQVHLPSIASVLADGTLPTEEDASPGSAIDGLSVIDAALAKAVVDLNFEPSYLPSSASTLPIPSRTQGSILTLRIQFTRSDFALWKELNLSSTDGDMAGSTLMNSVYKATKTVLEYLEAKGLKEDPVRIGGVAGGTRTVVSLPSVQGDMPESFVAEYNSYLIREANASVHRGSKSSAESEYSEPAGGDEGDGETGDKKSGGRTKQWLKRSWTR